MSAAYKTLTELGFAGSTTTGKLLALDMRRDVRVVVRLRGEAATARHLAVARAELAASGGG